MRFPPAARSRTEQLQNCQRCNLEDVVNIGGKRGDVMSLSASDVGTLAGSTTSIILRECPQRAR